MNDEPVDQTGQANNDGVMEGLSETRRVMVECLARTSLRPLVNDIGGILGSGKMLRARLIFRVGGDSGVPRRALVRCAAAVEMIHAASLLHDDVIDGSELRRGAPSFWVKKGVSGAILLGDLLVCQSIRLVVETEKGAFVPVLVELAGEMCDAETEQELLLRGQAPSWEKCVSIARRKTGALFAFAAYVCAGKDERLREALRESGYAIGTAYQLADDILDAYGDQALAGKTLGTDVCRSKITAVSASRNGELNPKERIDAFCESSRKSLSAWPRVLEGWDTFLAKDIYPSINNFTRSFAPDAVAEDCVAEMRG